MNVTKQLYQWDTGQKLTECTGIYVDFLIESEVYRVEVKDGTCIIPDELLQTPGRYKVWECMADNTLREFAFKVLPRPIPPNYVFTPTEQLTFEGLVQKETNKFNTNAIEKLNAYNANADNRVAEFNAQTEQIQTDVSELKSDLEYANKGLQTFRGLGNFQHYGLNPDGTFLSSQKYRVSNDDPMIFDRDLTISVATGFRWGYIPFVYGVAQSWTGWFVTPITIPKGTQFVVQIAKVSEITSETADVSEFLNAVTFSSGIGTFTNKANTIETAIGISNIETVWEQGGISETGGPNSDNARIRTGFLKIGDSSIEVNVANGYSAVIVQYDYSLEFLGGTSWKANKFEVQKIDNAVYFRVVLSRGMGSSAAISINEFTNVSINKKFVNLGERVANIEQTVNGGRYQYFGEKIPSKINSFDFQRLLTMSYDGSQETCQDIDIFGNYLFVTFSGLNAIKVYSLIDNTLIAEMSVDVQHGTGIQFSSEYYDLNDTMPLLYVGGWLSNTINVIRITNYNDIWSASIVKTLVISDTEGYYLAPSIDSVNNIMYCYGYKIGAISPTGNAMRLLKCDLSSLTDNGDGTYTPAILNRIETPYMGVMQGRKYYDGRLYVGFAETGTPHNCRLASIDVDTGQTMADIDLSVVTKLENEGVCYQINNNDITWYYSDYHNLFSLKF